MESPGEELVAASKRLMADVARNGGIPCCRLSPQQRSKAVIVRQVSDTGPVR